jgi:uridine kinase
MALNPHEFAASIIVSSILEKITAKPQLYTISLAGESGCGKTETSKALINELNRHGVKSIVLGQDNYFFLPPAANDAKRKEDSKWLGPHIEVNMKLLDETLKSAIYGANNIEIPHIDYDTNKETLEKFDITDIKVIIAEGTYTTLLKNIDTRIFISADYNDTLVYRKLRNRGNEVNDPFVENILETEHKIIAGHKFLADFIISKEYEVKIND